MPKQETFRHQHGRYILARLRLPIGTNPNAPAQGSKHKKTLQLEMRCKVNGAQDWIRTSTPLPALRPEHSASTNFATWAA